MVRELASQDLSTVSHYVCGSVSDSQGCTAYDVVINQEFFQKCQVRVWWCCFSSKTVICSCLNQKSIRSASDWTELNCQASQERGHITPVLASMHWLPVLFWNYPKISPLTVKALHGLSPAYLWDLLVPYVVCTLNIMKNNEILWQKTVTFINKSLPILLDFSDLVCNWLENWPTVLLYFTQLFWFKSFLLHFVFICGCMKHFVTFV